MRSMKRVMRPVIAATLVMLGSVAMNLASAGPASAYTTRTLQLDISGWMAGNTNQNPYRQRCNMPESHTAQTDGNGFVWIQIRRTCGDARVSVTVFGQMRDDYFVDLQYGATHRQNGIDTYRYEQFGLHTGWIHWTPRFTIGAGQNTSLDIQPLVHFY
jgi:hypothetical protein